MFGHHSAMKSTGYRPREAERSSISTSRQASRGPQAENVRVASSAGIRGGRRCRAGRHDRLDLNAGDADSPATVRNG
jgi:hypothetical protein